MGQKSTRRGLLGSFFSYGVQHVIVQRRGFYYRLDVYDDQRQLLTPQMLQKHLDWIVADADQAADGQRCSLYTCEVCDTWLM